MSAAHTPGPWKTLGAQFVCSESAVVAQQCKSMEDARLIAAAPDLLEALEALLSHTADLDPMQGYRPEEDFSAVKQARAAIAKATGEQA